MKENATAGHSSQVVAAASLVDAEPTRTSAAALFRAHSSFVAAFVIRLGVAHESADDVVQEVFLTAHRRGGYEQGAAKPTTWLAEIALRVVSTHKRSERRRRVVPDEAALDQAIETSSTPDETAENRSSLRRVQRALDQLDVDRRAVFILYELMDESCDDIARGLGIPVGTVHSRLFAARRAFQKVYERLDRSPLTPISREPSERRGEAEGRAENPDDARPRGGDP